MFLSSTRASLSTHRARPTSLRAPLVGAAASVHCPAQVPVPAAAQRQQEARAGPPAPSAGARSVSCAGAPWRRAMHLAARRSLERGGKWGPHHNADPNPFSFCPSAACGRTAPSHVAALLASMPVCGLEGALLDCCCRLGAAHVCAVHRMRGKRGRVVLSIVNCPVVDGVALRPCARNWDEVHGQARTTLACYLHLKLSAEAERVFLVCVRVSSVLGHSSTSVLLRLWALSPLSLSFYVRPRTAPQKISFRCDRCPSGGAVSLPCAEPARSQPW